METLREGIIEEVIKPIIPAGLMDKNVKILVNPTGRFVVGGPAGDSRLKSSKLGGDMAGCWFAPKLPKALPSAINQFVDAVLHGGEIIFDIDAAVALSEL